MKSFVRFAKGQAFGFAIIACAVVSFLFPSVFTAWGGVKLTSLVVPAVQLIMFGMGTTLTLADFVRVAKCPWAVAIGVFLQFLVMPFAGFSIARALGFSGELAAGCVLIGSVAGGTASNVIAYLARANVALSVTMTCCSTLLSPLVTPFMMKLLAGRFVEIDAVKMMVSILEVVLIPVVGGGLFHWIFRKQFELHKAACDKVLSAVSMGGICYTILALTAPSRDTFASAGVLIVVAAVLHNSFGYLSGYWLTRLAGRFLPLGESEARTVAIEVGMQNGGMAGALAVGVLNSAVAALPANVFSIWMNFSGSIIAGWWRKRPVEQGGRASAERAFDWNRSERGNDMEISVCSWCCRLSAKRVAIVGLLVGAQAMAEVVSVAEYGAVGDGRTDDTAAIMKAYAAAAHPDGTLFFPKNDRGSTYLTRKSLILVSGMTVSSDPGVVLTSASAVLEGGGQTIRRQVVKDSPKGATSVEVDDATGLKPGQEITIWQDEGSYRETLADIVKVEGNVIHFDTSRYSKDGTNLGNLFDRIGGKAVVLTDFALVKTVMSKEARDCAVENITIRSCGNLGDPYIYTISPFHQCPNRPAAQNILRLRNVTIDGSSQDGISTQGSGDIWVENCTVRNVKHKGIHWGTSCDRVIVRDNLCENCGSAEFEKISNNGGTGAMYFCVNNHRVLITGNTVRNCYKGVFGYDFRGQGETDTDSVIADNVFDNCTLGGLWIYDGFRLVMADNVFRNFSGAAKPIALNGAGNKRRLMKSGLYTGVVDGNVFVNCTTTNECLTVHEAVRRVAVGKNGKLSGPEPELKARPAARPGRIGARSEGLVLTGKGVVLEDAHIVATNGPALVIENTEDAVVKASLFSSKKGTAIEIRGENRNLRIEGCHVTDSLRGIVAAPGSRDVTIRWCSIQNCASNGVDLAGERFTVRANVFRRFGGSSQPVKLALKDSEFSANTLADFQSNYMNPAGVIVLAGSEEVRLACDVITPDRGAFMASFGVNRDGAKGTHEENCVFGPLDPRILTGDGVVAYRDPAVYFDGRRYHLFCTVVSTWKGGPVYSQLFTMSTTDFSDWRGHARLTKEDQKLNFSSPGNVIEFDGKMVLCCCSYPRPGYLPTDKVRWADDTARCYILRKGKKEKAWGEPELMKLKGDDVPFEKMGRMIDPYLVEDPKTPGKWWCFFKQGGIARSWTTDFRTWHYEGKVKGGENVCIVRKDDGKYLMFHSPADGIGLKESEDLVSWTDVGMAEIAGRENWPWAKGRLTAGAVIDCRKNPRVGKYVMFFHGSGPKTELEGDFDRNASIAMVVSDDLIHWR